MKPVVGRRYQLGEYSASQFEVIAYDEECGYLDIKHEDGSFEEMDISDWNDEVECGYIKELDDEH
jgi:hypothetical protein